MQVDNIVIGDIVRFKNNGMIGLVVNLVMDYLGDEMYAILWADGHKGNRCADDLEVVNASL